MLNPNPCPSSSMDPALAAYLESMGAAEEIRKEPSTTTPVAATPPTSPTTVSPQGKVWLDAQRGLPECINKSNFIRAVDGCYEIVHSPLVGTALIPVKDPEARQSLSDFEKNGIKLIDNFPKIPNTQWSPWVGLCFKMCEILGNARGSTTWSSGQEQEVSALLLRREDDPTIWKIVIPKQEVSKTRVDADFSESMDIVTGEKYTSFPPIDSQGKRWMHAGSTHSHNSMGAFFSTTDDKSELGVPGPHIVVGSIDRTKRSYTARASVVLRCNRKDIDLDSLVDTTPVKVKYHPDCLTMIKIEQVSSFRGGNMPYNRRYLEDHTWSLGAKWNPKTQRWAYEGITPTCIDIVTTKSGSVFRGVVTELCDAHIEIKHEESYNGFSYVQCTKRVLWSEIADIKIKQEQKLEKPPVTAADYVMAAETKAKTAEPIVEVSDSISPSAIASEIAKLEQRVAENKAQEQKAWQQTFGRLGNSEGSQVVPVPPPIPPPPRRPSRLEMAMEEMGASDYADLDLFGVGPAGEDDWDWDDEDGYSQYPFGRATAEEARGVAPPGISQADWEGWDGLDV